jgi:hypothetical protein
VVKVLSSVTKPFRIPVDHDRNAFRSCQLCHLLVDLPLARLWYDADRVSNAGSSVESGTDES